MHSWTLAILGLSTAAGAQMPGAGDGFCGELARVISAAAETPPFASLPGFDERGEVAMFGFARGCGQGRIPGGEPYFACHRQLPPLELRVAALAARIARCLPSAERLADSRGGSLFRQHVVRFRIPGVTIELAEGGWATRGGGQVALTIQRDR